MLIHQGEGSGTPSEPHHTPFPEAEISHPTTLLIPLPSIPTALIPPVTQPVITPIIQYSRRARIAQSSALPTVADEPASPVRDDSQGEACPTDFGFIVDQDRATIVKSSTLPHDLAPRVTSPAVDEGSIQHNISELTALCTSLQRQYSELQAKFQAQEEEIVKLKDRVKVLEDREGVAAKQSGDDAPIKGRSINEGEAAAERIKEELQRMIDSLDKSNDTIAKYLQEYQDFASELPLEKRIELISDLKEQVKKQKSSEEAPEIETSTEEFTEEQMKEMMQLVPIEDVYVQALQVKHLIIDWKVYTEGQRSY
nr:hypothetical protein [Tanacetum cinerariifolium]